jgi:hypothetical protein
LCFSTASSRKTETGRKIVNLQPLHRIKVLQEQQTQHKPNMLFPAFKTNFSSPPRPRQRNAFVAGAFRRARFCITLSS